MTHDSTQNKNNNNKIKNNQLSFKLKIGKRKSVWLHFIFLSLSKENFRFLNEIIFFYIIYRYFLNQPSQGKYH